jgi:hypothetical protein
VRVHVEKKHKIKSAVSFGWVVRWNCFAAPSNFWGTTN